MKIAVVLSLLAAASQSPPQRLDDPAAVDAAAAEARSVIACADKFLATPDSDELIGSYLDNSPLAELFASASANAGQSDTPAKQAARTKVETCLAGASRQESARKFLEPYVGFTLAERGLLRKLKAASIDVGGLASFDPNDLITRRISATDTEALFKKFGVTKPHENEAIGYIFVHKINSVFGDLNHPPAHFSHRVSGAISNTDYPAKALDLNVQGASVLVYEVSEAGSVVRCETAFSSGSELLDQTACKLIMQRYRFEPASDEQGKPVRQRLRQTVRWRIEPPPKAPPKAP